MDQREPQIAHLGMQCHDFPSRCRQHNNNPVFHDVKQPVIRVPACHIGGARHIRRAKKKTKVSHARATFFHGSILPIGRSPTFRRVAIANIFFPIAQKIGACSFALNYRTSLTSPTDHIGDFAGRILLWLERDRSAGGRVTTSRHVHKGNGGATRKAFFKRTQQIPMGVGLCVCRLVHSSI